jgi:hypothetical protein
MLVYGVIVPFWMFKNMKPKALNPVPFNSVVSPMNTCNGGHDRVRLVLWWEQRLGKTILSDITPEIIRDVLKPKKSKAPATYNKHLAVLSAILDYATVSFLRFICSPFAGT